MDRAKRGFPGRQHKGTLLLDRNIRCSFALSLMFSQDSYSGSTWINLRHSANMGRPLAPVVPTILFHCRCGRKYFFRCSRASAYFPVLPVKADYKAGKRTGYPAVRQKRPQCPPDRSRTLILRGGTPACTAISCQIFPSQKMR